MLSESSRGIINSVGNVNWPPLRVSELTFRASALRPYSDEGLTLGTSALKLFTVANLRYQLS